MSILICQMCGHIAFGNAPDSCPVCKAPKTSFAQNDAIFEESEKNSPEGSKKHIPTIEVVKKCGLVPEESCIDVIIRVGEVLHPMTDAHFITFIDTYVGDQFVERVMLSPKVNPVTCIHLKAGTTGTVKVVERCNLHGYWGNQQAI